MGRAELRKAMTPVIAKLRRRLPAADARREVEAALANCKALYLLGRSDEALALGRSALALARRVGDSASIYRGLAACGILAADAFDLVGGLEYHLESLRLAAREPSALETSSAWNNIGLALALAGLPAMAARAYERAIETVRDIEGPVHTRYAACTNRANSLFHLGDYERGLQSALEALRELTPEFDARDPLAVILLLRNTVHLLVAVGRIEEAAGPVEEMVRRAAAAGSSRAFIACSTARGAFELARGETDIALTRLDQALAKARETPQALRDALVSVMRAEEIAGYPERALTRLRELSEHVYSVAVEKARRNVEMADLDVALALGEHADRQTHARLVSRLDRPSAPGGWDALRRLAVSAGLRVDGSGWHGRRVGALTKALALACEEPPLRALEMGLAAELHDVGLLTLPADVISRGVAGGSEREAYLRHTIAGADILRDDGHPRLLIAREVATYHHAWWDGSGHPRKVGGTSIPVAARMCAVADAYDEIMCGFLAQRSHSMDEALGQLRAKAGTQLDPALVRCFETVVRGEAATLGIDTARDESLEGFQELVANLQEDRGFL